MKIKEILSNLGSLVLGILFLIIIFAIGILIFVGVAWLAENVLPILILISIFTLLLNIIIFGPLAIIPRTRRIAGIGLFISACIYGITGWLMGFLYTFTLWGTIALIIGIIILGIGVIPLGLLATLFNGMWPEFGLLAAAVILYFVAIIIGSALADKE